jgi:hypothetical protein
MPRKIACKIAWCTNPLLGKIKVFIGMGFVDTPDIFYIATI